MLIGRLYSLVTARRDDRPRSNPMEPDNQRTYQKGSQPISFGVGFGNATGIIRSFRGSFVENGHHFTHGTPDDVREWVFPEDVYNPEKLNRIAKQFAAVCVCGHSHIQGIFKQNDQSEWEFVNHRLESVTTASRSKDNSDCRFGWTITPR